MKKYILLLITLASFVMSYAQPVAKSDTILLSGISPVNLSLLSNDLGSNIVILQYIVSNIKYSPSNNTRTISNFGKIVLRTNGTGTFTPISNYKNGSVRYTIRDSRNRTSTANVVFVTKVVPPDPTPTPNPTPIGNVSYTWKGAIGNTSTNDFGPRKLKSLRSATSISELNGYLYLTTGFSERNSTIFKVLISNPTLRYEVPPKTNEDIALEGTCGVSDGTRFYMVGFDPHGYDVNGGTGYSSKIDCAVVAYDINDNEVVFQYGQSTSCTIQDNPYKSLIAVVRGDTSQKPVKLEVDNQYLYVYTRTLIKKYDKVTGLYLSMTNYVPAATISTHTRNGVTLTMTSTNVTYNGTVLCSAQTSPKVDNYTYTPKDFNTFKTKGYVYIGSDGSFWVADAGNGRVLHYSSTGVYINQIAYIPMNYNCSVDRNNPTRVFAGFLEYKITYPSLAWELVNNWSYGLNKAYTPNEQCLNVMESVVTFNNETYAIVDSFIQYDGYSMRWPSKMRLTNTGLKRIRVYDAFQNVWYGTDGNEYILTFEQDLGKQSILYRNGVEIDRIPVITETSASYGGSQIFAYKDTLYLFNPDKNKLTNSHFEAIKGGKLLFNRAPGKYSNNRFCNLDTFTIYDNGGHAGGLVLSICNNVQAYMYAGEGFQNAQTTKLFLYKNGQYVTTIGKTYAEAIDASGVREAPKEFAGNAFAGNLVYVSGTYYYFFNDEHGGSLHCFIITGL